MKDSELLREARHKIKQGHSDGICSAINLAAGTFKSPQVKSLKHWIENMLGSHAYLEAWLEANGYIAKSNWDDYSCYTSETWRKVEITRLAWLDWMIEQCEIAEAKETK